MLQTIDDQATPHRCITTKIITAAAPIYKIITIIEVKVIIFIYKQQVVRFTDVIIDYIDNHRDVLIMEILY